MCGGAASWGRGSGFGGERRVHRLIAETDIEKALDYLRDSATSAAQARANRIYMESYVKVVKAQEQQKHIAAGASVSAGEVHALVSGEYISSLEALKEAVRLDEHERFMREAAQAKIEAWRTFCANERKI